VGRNQWEVLCGLRARLQSFNTEVTEILRALRVEALDDGGHGEFSFGCR